jgi:hypothetical protein
VRKLLVSEKSEQDRDIEETARIYRSVATYDVLEDTAPGHLDTEREGDFESRGELMSDGTGGVSNAKRDNETAEDTNRDEKI